jgi:hypothetical protein
MGETGIISESEILELSPGAQVTARLILAQCVQTKPVENRQQVAAEVYGIQYGPLPTSTTESLGLVAPRHTL